MSQFSSQVMPARTQVVRVMALTSAVTGFDLARAGMTDSSVFDGLCSLELEGAEGGAVPPAMDHHCHDQCPLELPGGLRS